MRDYKYRYAIGVALAAASILAWLSLGVGIIGRDGDPANLMYFGVLAVGIIGAIVARFRPHGMARALFVMALAQALVAVIALIFGLGLPWSPPAEILALNGFFVALFLGAAWLFRDAARERPPAGAGPEDGRAAG
jgi:O-antigen/teichoic acid export membrane protein